MDLTFIWQPRFFCVMCEREQGCCSCFGGPSSVFLVVFTFSQRKKRKNIKKIVFILLQWEQALGVVWFRVLGADAMCVFVYIWALFFDSLGRAFSCKTQLFRSRNCSAEQKRCENWISRERENLCIWFQLIFRVRAWLRIVLFIVGQIRCCHKLA